MPGPSSELLKETPASEMSGLTNENRENFVPAGVPGAWVPERTTRWRSSLVPAQMPSLCS
jgi:hypothetical protein